MPFICRCFRESRRKNEKRFPAPLTVEESSSIKNLTGAANAPTKKDHTMTNSKTTVRFLDSSVKLGTLTARVHYSINNRADGQKGVTVYGKDYASELHPIFGDMAVNNSDSMTDYFEKSRVFIPEGHELYSAALERAEAKRAKDEARWAATQERRAARAEAKRAAQQAEWDAFKAGRAAGTC
jgi:hypothetical protein